MLGVPLPLDRTTSLSALLLNDTVKEQKLQEEVPLTSHMKLPVATSRPMFSDVFFRIRGQERRRGLGKSTRRDTAFGVLLGEKSVPRKRICSKNSGPFFQKAFAIKDCVTHITCARSTGRLFALCAGRSRQTDT